MKLINKNFRLVLGLVFLIFTTNIFAGNLIITSPGKIIRSDPNAAASGSSSASGEMTQRSGAKWHIDTPTAAPIGKADVVAKSAAPSVPATPAAPAATPSSGLYNFVAGDKATCESSIAGRLPGRAAICSIGGGCGISCGMPGANCPSANPKVWGACIDASVAQAPAVTSPPPPSAAPSSGLFNFVAGDKTTCEKSISDRLSGKKAICTIGGGCGVSCGMPGAICLSANPTAWGACINPAVSCGNSSANGNLDYIKRAKDSAVEMLVGASKKYKAGSITNEEYIQVSLQVAQMADYSNNQSVDCN